MSSLIPSSAFQKEMERREAERPFGRVSAYKVHESWANLQDNLMAVRSTADCVRSGSPRYHHTELYGCTKSDKAERLRRVPMIIAHQLGYNLIPAVKALDLEGVPASETAAFLRSIMPQVKKLLADCDDAHRCTRRSVWQEYEAMTMGTSSMEDASLRAVEIADLARDFCKSHRL